MVPVLAFGALRQAPAPQLEQHVAFLNSLPQFVMNGIAIGSIYALIALGFVTIYNVTGIINLAQGEFLMLGAMISVSLGQWLPLPLAGLVAVLATSAVGAGVYGLTLRPARQSSPTTLIIITIGVSVVLRGAALLIWRADPYRLPPFSEGRPLDLGLFVVTRQTLWIIGITLVAVLLLYLFFNRTMTGRGLRACALNPNAARLMGVPLQRMSTLAFALSAALAAIGGIAIAPVQYAQYDMGLILGLKGFVAAIMGGLTNPAGAIVGGLLLGGLEAITAGAVGAAYKDAIAFVILIAVLLVRRLMGARGSADLSRGGL